MGPQKSPKRLLDELREDARLRRASQGPLAASASVVRTGCEVGEMLLAEIKSTVPYTLELLDAQLERAYGPRWWETMSHRLTDAGGDA